MSAATASRSRSPISEAELDGLTADLDDMHHARCPVRESLAEWRDSDDDVRAGITRLVVHPASRRGFLLGGGAVLGGFALVGSGVRQSASAAAVTRTPAARPPWRSESEAHR